jgi:hypothetical protein
MQRRLAKNLMSRVVELFRTQAQMPEDTAMPPEQRQTRPEDRLARERADIARRVANFRAHQARLEQERDDYYKSVRAKISRTLGASRTTETSK